MAKAPQQYLDFPIQVESVITHFVRPLGIPHTKVHTKFEVSSSSSFRDIAL